MTRARDVADVATTVISGGLATDSELSSAISAHSSDTTSVHGITDTSALATQTYVTTQVNNLIDAAPSSLDTLKELASALNNDKDFAVTVTNSLATKASTGKAIAMSIVFGG